MVSYRLADMIDDDFDYVLILVVMEDGLVLSAISVGKNGDVNVLILVVMEDGLVLS